ncbi:hypothetical protein GN244_ATG20281 [Phytophthora infestans]|uniref:Uncharacterized protein n=1 Tax=Phytophthora infestans TaxID=4787 RepID=A0A833SP21_PHYIN|nr:hypothetical protein GN244_ATG20281 [Phytophthora infestans]KAF4132416.1 hypothetical protein GN958_ATG18386 [Phytophthora infestans]
MAIHTKVLTVDVDLTATIIATAAATIVSNTIEVATVVVVVTTTILQLQPVVSSAPFTERPVSTSRSTALCGRTTNKTSTSKWSNVVVLGLLSNNSVSVQSAWGNANKEMKDQATINTCSLEG